MNACSFSLVRAVELAQKRIEEGQAVRVLIATNKVAARIIVADDLEKALKDGWIPCLLLPATEQWRLQ